jgi:hypothetical protein
MSLYLIPNGASPTTAAQVVSDTGTAIKTLLQVKIGANYTIRGKVVEWGISFGGSAAATPVKVELLTTGTVAATVTAHAAAGIINLDPLASAPTDGHPFSFSSNTTGWMATGASGGEGSISTTRMLDVQNIAPTSQFIKQWPLGREPMFAPTNYLRIRVTSGVNYTCYCYVVVEV